MPLLDIIDNTTWYRSGLQLPIQKCLLLLPTTWATPMKFNGHVSTENVFVLWKFSKANLLPLKLNNHRISEAYIFHLHLETFIWIFIWG